MLKRPLILAACAMFATISTATAQNVDADTVVARVDGVEVTIGHMIILRDGLPDQYRNLPDQVLFDGILEQLVQQQVLANRFDGLSAAIELRLENEERGLRAGAKIDELIAENVSESAVQELYETKYENFVGQPEFNASHILVETEAEALSLVDLLADGADFAELAVEHSTGPSGPGGGNLGWFGQGAMVPPFEAAVVSLEVGEVSAPVQTQFGWHVIILNEARETTAPSLAEVQNDLRNELSETVISATLEAMTASADIADIDNSAIDPAILSDLSLVSE